jgi:hypothetical protein
MQLLSEDQQLEIKLHWRWFLSILPAAVLFVLTFRMPIFDRWPLWAVIAFGLFMAVGHYCWWRQCLSPDKKTFTPRIWK